MTKNIIEVKNLSTHFYTNSGTIKAVNDVSFTIPYGKTLAIVGESGSGKSATALSIMRLIPKSSAEIVSGEVIFDDIDLLKLTERQMRRIRGKDIGMIFQEPMTSLNPVMKIGDQIMEVSITHEKLSKSQAKEKTINILTNLGITSADKRINNYPHQLSGGMKQRVMIAISMICSPKLLIADEPTTSLDVTIQATIIDLIKSLQKVIKMSIMFITHDLAVVAKIADYVLVMYAGNVIEHADVNSFFRKTKHPYSRELLRSCTPSVQDKKEKYNNHNRRTVNTYIRDSDISVYGLNTGCSYYYLCKNAMDKCKTSAPFLNNDGFGHNTACWLFN